MKHTVTSRTVTVTIEDALPVTVTTSSLRKRIIVPVRAEVTTGRTGSTTVLLTGPAQRESGQMTATWFKGKVSVDPEDSTYVGAPKWVHALVDEVIR